MFAIILHSLCKQLQTIFRRICKSANSPEIQSIVADKAFARHVGRLLQSHDVEDGGSNVGQAAVLHGGAVVVGHVDEGHGVQRVSGVGRAVGVDGVVGIAVVGNDDGLVVVGLGSLDDLANAVVDGPDGFGDGVVDTGVAC